MKRSVVALLSLAIALPLTTPATAGAQPAPTSDQVTDRVTEIGTPLQDVLLIGGVVAPGPGGRTVLWSASSGAPAHLNAVDPNTGEVLARYPLTGSGGSWAVTSAPDGSVYVGTYGSAKLFRWTEAGGLTDLGRPFGADFVWDVATDENSVVYGGTSSGGSLFSYDPATGQFRDYGQLDPERLYVRSVDTHGDTIYAGTENPGLVYAVDKNTGERTALPLPEDLTDHDKSWAYDVDVVGDHLYVRFGEAFPAPLHVWDITAGRWVDRIENVHGLEPSPADTGGEVYLIRSNELVRYDPATGELTETGVPFTGRVANTRGIGWAELDDPDYPGQSLVGLLWRGQMFRYNPETGASSFLPTAVQGEPIDITTLSEGPDGRVYTGGFLNGGFAAVNPDSGAIEEFNTFSQSEGMLNHNGTLYVGAYPDARVYAYDPALPWHSPEYSPHPEPGHADNPKRLFDFKAQRQIRPRALTGAGDLVAVGTLAVLGELAGVLALYDPATGELVTSERGVVTDQGIEALAYRDGVLYGGTTIYSGHSATPPTQTEAKVFAWSVAEGRKLWEFVPAPGKPTIPALSFDDQGRLWGVAGQEVFAVDVDTAEVTVRHSYGSSTSSAGSLEYNPVDGLLYGSLAGRTLFSLDPDGDGERTVLADRAVGHLAVHSSGDVYASSGSTLLRYDTPVCAESGTAPDPRPTVVLGTVDSGVTNHATGPDCTVNDLIRDDRPWSHHGLFVAHVGVLAARLVEERVLTWYESVRIVAAAARSDVGR